MNKIRQDMRPGERVFVLRTQVVLIECFENNTNNTNDARDRVYNEVKLAATEIIIPDASVPESIAKVNA